MQDKDRYVIRPMATLIAGAHGMHRDAVVYGAKNLSERQAREMVERLNDVYRRSKE